MRRRLRQQSRMREALLVDLGARGEATVDGMAANAERVLDRLGAGVADMEQRILAAAQRMEQLQATTPPAIVPTPSRRAAGEQAKADQAALTCEYCGFIAKTPAGLAAHRRAHR